MNAMPTGIASPNNAVVTGRIGEKDTALVMSTFTTAATTINPRRRMSAGLMSIR